MFPFPKSYLFAQSGDPNGGGGIFGSLTNVSLTDIVSGKAPAIVYFLMFIALIIIAVIIRLLTSSTARENLISGEGSISDVASVAGNRLSRGILWALMPWLILVGGIFAIYTFVPQVNVTVNQLLTFFMPRSPP